MKTFIITTCMGLMLVSWTALENIMDKVGLSEDTARKHILQNITRDFSGEPLDSESQGGEEKEFGIPRLRLLPDLMKGDKAGTARELCAYIKEYVSSKEFSEAYQQQRNAAKPISEPPRLDAATITSLKSSVTEMEANLSQMKAAKMPADLIKQMEKGIAQQKKMIAGQSDPTPNLTLWKELYPEDPSIAVKNSLNEYLLTVATVDFNAATTGSGKNRKFARPDYEAQSLKWKAIYRAGKEVNEVVSTFAKQWLKEGVKTAH